MMMMIIMMMMMMMMTMTTMMIIIIIIIIITDVGLEIFAIPTVYVSCSEVLATPVFLLNTF